MPTQSLPVGDTTSPTALCSESHMNTQHTVTGECGHYCWTSEAMAVKAACTTNHPVILPLLGAIVSGGKVPLVVRPLLMVQTSMLLQKKVCTYISTPSDLPSVSTSSSSQSGATAADKGPSTEMEPLAITQQGMLHAVSLHTSAPHSVPSVGGVSVHVCIYMRL